MKKKRLLSTEEILEFFESDLESRFFEPHNGFPELLEEWVQVRNELRKPLTRRAVKMTAKKFNKHKIDSVTNALYKSVINSWQGVFPK